MELVSITQMIKMIKPFPAKTKQTYLVHCRKNLLPCFQNNGKWYVSKKYVTAAIDWRKNAVYITDLINSRLTKEETESTKWINNRRNLTRKISKFYLPDNEYSILFDGEFIDSKSKETVFSIIENEKNAIFGREGLIPLANAAKSMNLSIYQIKKLINEGQIKAKNYKSTWYISRSEIDRYISNSNDLVSILSIAGEICSVTKSEFDVKNRSDRSRLNSFMRLSPLQDRLISWKESGLHTDRKNALFIHQKYHSEAKSLIHSFILNYAKTRNSISSCLVDAYWSTHNETRDLFLKYAENHNEKSMVAIGNAIAGTMNCELTQACNTDIQKIMTIIAELNVQRYRKDFIQFIAYIKKNNKCNFNIEFSLSLNPKKQPTSTVRPYQEEQYIKFGKMCLDFDTAIRMNLFEKAIDNPQLSYAWLYSTWHYIAAWRKGDIESQIPMIPVSFSWEYIKENIQSADFDSTSLDYSLQLEEAINSGNLLPKKTKNKQKRRFLSISIPTSQRLMIGRIYIIFANHYKEDCMYSKVLTFKVFYDLFGDDYYRLFGMNALSNRKANKSYLNFISKIVSEKGVSSNILSYRIASYARAHVENNGLSETTSKYLMHSMDGMSPNDILIRLFENGFCSFTVRYLLEIAYGERFGRLRFTEQADIIHRMKLSSFRAESIARLMDDSYHRSKNLVTRLFEGISSSNEQKCKAELILNNLGKKLAITNTNGISCLILASRGNCPFRHLRQCAGCKYNIYDISFFRLLINSINQSYIKLKNAKSEGTRRLIKSKITQEMLPSAYEIIFLAKKQYKYDLDNYIQQLIEITKQGGIEND